MYQNLKIKYLYFSFNLFKLFIYNYSLIPEALFNNFEKNRKFAMY